MLEATEIKTEPEVMNIRSQKTEPEKPMLDNRDMCAFMCIICAALITYILSEKIPYNDSVQFYGTIVCIIASMSLALFWLTQKIVRHCHIRAKRKARDN